MRPHASIPLLALVVLVACSRLPAEVVPPASKGDSRGFSGELAFGHLERLAEIGPRASGTAGAARAREYLRGQLESLDLEVAVHEVAVDLEAGERIELQSLIATIPGASPDLVVLVAPYDTRYFAGFDFVGANGGASGPALLLEMARVLSLDPLPYTTWIAFLEGEAPLGRGNPREATTAWIGSSQLARLWASDERLESIRLLVYFDRVADADLGIARDLRSHRSYREVFWDVARGRGHADAFAQNQHYESPAAGHLPFIARGLRRTVLLMDTSFGGDEPPGLYADTEDDTPARCSEESLGTVGEVSLAALVEITDRLAKIDRFAETPPDASVLPLTPGSQSPRPDRAAPEQAATDGQESPPQDAGSDPEAAQAP